LKIGRITALGRPLDIDYMTNRLIATVTAVVLAAVLAVWLIIGQPFFESLFFAAGTAVSVFLTWAITREIDPPSDWSAFAGLPFTLVAALFYGFPALITLFFILLVARTISGSTSLKLTLFDSSVLLVFGVILFTNGVITGLPFLAAVFILDSFFEPANRRQLYFAPVALVLFFVVYAAPYEQYPYVIGFTLPTGIFTLLLIGATVFLAIRTGKVTVPGDKSEQPLNPRRIQLAQAAIALFMVGELFLKGNISLYMLYPAGFAYLGAVLYHLVMIAKAGEAGGRG